MGKEPPHQHHHPFHPRKSSGEEPSRPGPEHQGALEASSPQGKEAGVPSLPAREFLVTACRGAGGLPALCKDKVAAVSSS